MKRLLLLLIVCLSWNIFAQKPCEMEPVVQDSLGVYKSTKQYLIFERSFAGNSTNIYFSLASSNGVMLTEMQMITRSPDFIKALCFNKNSKIFLQLANGKIIPLIGVEETCGSFIQSEDGYYNRILNNSFIFTKEHYQDLKKSPVTFMRIQYSGESIDYPFKSSITSEADNKTYYPETYFMDYLKCLDN